MVGTGGGGGQTTKEREQLVNVFLKRVDLAWVAGTNRWAPLIGRLQRLQIKCKMTTFTFSVSRNFSTQKTKDRLGLHSK